MNKNLSDKEKLDHIRKCEFYRGSKKGNCPLVSKEEAKKLR